MAISRISFGDQFISHVPESNSRRSRPDNIESPLAPPLELDTDPPDTCSALVEIALPSTSGTGPAMAICKAAKIMREILMREKGIICACVVSSLIVE